MSRIGKKPIDVPGGVKVAVAECHVTVEGPLGKLEWEHRPEITVVYDASAKQIRCSRERRRAAEPRLARPDPGADPEHGRRRHRRATRSSWKSSASATSPPCRRTSCELRVGLANELHKPIPAGLKVACPDQQHVVIKGIDKQLVGQFAAEVRALRKPEPYKGKGIRYDGEAVRRKQGKAMAK